MQIIRTMDELDQMLVRLDAAQKVSDDELRKLFRTFRMEFEKGVPVDPYSAEYKAAQFELYKRISGKDYNVKNEVSAFNLEHAAARPFPYYTGSCETVGDHLAAIAHVVRTLRLAPGAKVLEFGPGWGNTTLTLAMMGFDVTAVDIEKNFCDLIARRAAQVGVPLKVVNADFSWIEQVTEPVDAVLFFESFHHCSDHLRLIQALGKAVKEDGRVFFAAEPVTTDFPLPWGLRLDGESLWAIRNFGWLELGFNERYFLETLKKFGWRVEKHVGAGTSWGTVYEAAKWKTFMQVYTAGATALRTQAGAARADGSIVATGDAGFLVFGPYARVPAGSYRATLEFADSASIDGQLDVACRGGGLVLGSRAVSLRAQGTVSIEFKLATAEADLEVRLLCLKGASGAVRSLTIEELAS